MVDAYQNHGAILTSNCKACGSHFNDFGLFEAGTVIPMSETKSLEGQHDLFVSNMLGGVEGYANAKIMEYQALEKEMIGDGGSILSFRRSQPKGISFCGRPNKKRRTVPRRSDTGAARVLHGTGVGAGLSTQKKKRNDQNINEY